MVFEQAQRGFKLGTSEAIHGSLLGYKELFLEGQTVRMIAPEIEQALILAACSS